MTNERFATSVDHLLAELERIDLLIRARVATLRRAQTEDEHFRGLYISEQEVDELLRRPIGTPQWLTSAQPARWADIEDALATIATTIDARKQRSVDGGVELRLERLRQLYNPHAERALALTAAVDRSDPGASLQLAAQFPQVMSFGGRWWIKELDRNGTRLRRLYQVRELTGPDDPEIVGLRNPDDPMRLNCVRRPVQSK